MIPLQSFGSTIFYQPNITGLSVDRFSSAFDGIFLFPLTHYEQKISTPASTIMSPRVSGKLPRIVSQFIEPGGSEYYFQWDTNKLCLTRINYPPHNQSEIWISAKQKFRDAVSAWQLLSDDEKKVFQTDPRAIKRRLPGYQFFLSLYLQS